MDIWLKANNENRDKLIQAHNEYGVIQEDLNAISKQDFTKIQFFYFGKKPRRVDFLTNISGITFDVAEKEVNHFPLQNEMIPIIQYHHLILSKITSERIKDKADVQELQNINKFKNND